MPYNRTSRSTNGKGRRSHLMLPRFHLFAAIYYWSVYSSTASLVNITVDDTDPSIVYQPPESWNASSVICSTCLNPDVRNAYLGTYHDGTNLVSSVSAPTVPVESHEGDDGEEDDSGKGKDKGKQGQGDRLRSLLHRRVEVAGKNVTTEFEFTGTAVYVYCIQPLGVPLVNTTPTSMNLTFHIDNVTQGTFLHQGSDNASGYLPGVNVFSNTSLADSSHLLRVNVGPNSVFLLDYIVYTTATTPLVQDIPNPSESANPNTKHRNIGTFIGAIVGSVGVLGLVALGLAYSIIKRRRNYERRERLESNNTRSSASDDSPRNSAGPAPFVPRFFPGTPISADPPPYVESLSAYSDAVSRSIDTSSATGSSHATTAPIEMRSSSFVTVPITYNAHLANHQDVSYADVPPSSPPPPLDDMLIKSSPPPFTVAIASKHTSPDPSGTSSRLSDSQTSSRESEETHEFTTLVTDPLLPGQGGGSPVHRHSSIR